MNNVLSSENPFWSAIAGIWENMAMYMPKILAAIFLIVIGWYLAGLVSRLVGRLMAKMGINKLGDTIGLTKTLKSARFTRAPSDIIGLLFFWLILLLFVITAIETLGLPRLSSALDDMVMYLPKVLVAIFILVVGLLLAQAVQGIVEPTLASMGLNYGRNLGNIAYGMIIIIVLSLAIGELEIETLLLNSVIIILLAALALAGALSLGLGTRGLSNDIVSGVYAREMLCPGERLEFDGQIGVVEEVGTMKTRMLLDDGASLSIPNHLLIKGSFKIHP